MLEALFQRHEPTANPPNVIGRLAPSPTGGLHLGNARTFLIAWLAAKSRNGRILLRIEDIDAERRRPEAINAVVEDLQWLGLDWDDTPIYQSTRLEQYRRALERLRAMELVYPCTCTRADIARAASAPHESDQGPDYPGTCAIRSSKDAETLADRKFAWRFRVPIGRIDWNDLAQGPISLDLSGIGGDFVVGRSSGEPAYQLAVVVDDAAMKVTQVIRGDDLASSTPRQILIFQSLGFSLPEFGHVPLVVDENGLRLAKRDGSIKLSMLREQGVDPRKIIGLLARSCGLSERLEPLWPDDWVERFSFKAIPSEAWRLSNDWLTVF